MDKLGVFHADQTSMCLDPHSKLKVRLGGASVSKALLKSNIRRSVVV